MHPMHTEHPLQAGFPTTDAADRNASAETTFIGAACGAGAGGAILWQDLPLPSTTSHPAE